MIMPLLVGGLLVMLTVLIQGYGDITLSTQEWRLLTGIEALNGVLMLGWSTALLFAVVHRSWSSYLRR